MAWRGRFRQRTAIALASFENTETTRAEQIKELSNGFCLNAALLGEYAVEHR
jgi:hypothetical protein